MSWDSLCLGTRLAPHCLDLGRDRRPPRPDAFPTRRPVSARWSCELFQSRALSPTSSERVLIPSVRARGTASVLGRSQLVGCLTLSVRWVSSRGGWAAASL